MELPKWDDQVLIIEAHRYPKLPEMDCVGMIYAPGLVCSYCGKTLSLGFVVKNNAEDGVFGRECVMERNAPSWRSMMQRARYYLEASQFDLEEDLKPKQRKYLRGLSLLTQVAPWSNFAQAMYARMRDGYKLSEAQNAVVDRMVGGEGRHGRSSASPRCHPALVDPGEIAAS